MSPSSRTRTETTSETPLEVAAWLRDASGRLDPEHKAAYVYHPMQYAWNVHKTYMERYGDPPKKALLVGMNPGPWGMGQVGVPFGTIDIAADWLGLGGIPVDQPMRLHPKRPVKGWDCTRQEVSGQRLWGFLRETYGAADAALSDLLVVNHCPLLMFDEEGRNVTPDKLLKADREAVFDVSDEGVARMARATRAEVLIGVGAYAETRCQAIVDDPDHGLDVAVDQIPHPSPASPLANKDGGVHWRKAVRETFQKWDLIDD